jgi:Na+-translocating ferredoxin:NAD+ oxidoreductase RNF subunit RnfB
MGWLSLPIAFGLVLVSAFLASTFLASAWERRQKRNPGLERAIACLPGYDCGFCGHEDCRRYALSVLENGGDPGLCSPGAERAEEGLRKCLDDGRAEARMAFVRCARQPLAAPLYAYDGREDCKAAFSLFGGPERCPDSCLGLGSCAHVCPLGAIKVEGGLARVIPERCSGCGLCLAECPTKVLALVPRHARWQVACNSPRSAEEKKKDCASACIACGECARLSTAWEFSVSGNLAQASSRALEGRKDEADWENLAHACPTKAIVRAGRRPPRPGTAEEGAEAKPKD